MDIEIYDSEIKDTLSNQIEKAQQIIDNEELEFKTRRNKIAELIVNKMTMEHNKTVNDDAYRELCDKIEVEDAFYNKYARERYSYIATIEKSIEVKKELLSKLQ